MGVDLKEYLFGLEHQIHELKRRNRVIGSKLVRLLREKEQMRNEMAHLDKEREMLWKTVDRLEKEMAELDRYSVTDVVKTRGNRALLQIIDGKTGKIGHVAIQITADGKVRGLG